MRHLFFIIYCILLTTAAFSQEFSFEEWENEKVVEINKEPSRTSFFAYATKEQALQNIREASPWLKSLNGNWKFLYSNHPEQRPKDFYNPSLDDSRWNQIP
ncbi:MAG: hypothetical protein RIR48_2896, partial [Bacteroidota bacterium]